MAGHRTRLGKGDLVSDIRDVPWCDDCMQVGERLSPCPRHGAEEWSAAPQPGERFPEFLARVRGISLAEAQRRSDFIDRRVAALMGTTPPDELRGLVAHLVGVLEGNPPRLSRDCDYCRLAERIARQVRNVP